MHPPTFALRTRIPHRTAPALKMMTTMGVITPSSTRTARIKQGNDPSEVRPCQAVVSAVFGPTPEYWLEYQLLQLENQVRQGGPAPTHGPPSRNPPCPLLTMGAPCTLPYHSTNSHHI